LYLCHLRSLLLSLFCLPQCLLYENSMRNYDETYSHQL
jgi:hypothetical protein